MLRARLKAMYPDADVRISEVAGKVVLEGTASSLTEMVEIRKLIEVYTANATVVDLLRAEPGGLQRAIGQFSG